MRAVGVIGKLPKPGAVKTRLSPLLDPRQAALLSGAFLRDTLLSALTVRCASVSLIHPPVSGSRALDGLVPDGVACVEESGAGLDSAMRGAFDNLFARGATSAVLIGSDLPTLPASRIEEAFVTLERGTWDVVLGPAGDGGYYLIGLRAPQPALFERIDWSTDRVLGQTLERARSAALRVALIEPWHDVDDAADLLYLSDELAEAPAHIAPTTRQVLATIAPVGL